MSQNQTTKSLTSSQKRAICNFQTFTSASAPIAREYLSRHNWKIEVACDEFFSNPPPASTTQTTQRSADRGKIEQLFQKYTDLTYSTPTIANSGMERFLSDLNVEADDIITIIIAWKFNARSMCEFSKDEFVEGMFNLGCESIESLKGKLESLRAEIVEEVNFKKFYRFCFSFGLETGQHSLEVEMASLLLSLIFEGRDKSYFVEEWINYIEGGYTKAISKDTWYQFLDFAETYKTREDLSQFDYEGAWPVVIDEFVEWNKSNQMDED